MLILSNEQIEQMLTMPACMAVLKEMYRDVADHATLSMPRTDNIVPCSAPEAYYAFKYMGGVWPRHQIVALRLNSDIITHPTIGNSTRRVKVPLANGRWVGLVQLYSTETGELLAMFPDGVAQRMRVGAASGLAIEYLARPDARRAGMIGTGWQAGSQLMALLAARPIEEVKVYSIRKESREAFVAEARVKTGANIRAVDSAEECAREVDILLAATSSMVPVIQPEWLCEGMHIGCIKVQEMSQAVLSRCDRVAIHNKSEARQIDNILADTPHLAGEDRGGWWDDAVKHWDDFAGLPELVAGRKSGRVNAKEITCFVNNTGLGLQFAALGTILLEQAKKMGVGTELPGDWFSETVHP